MRNLDLKVGYSCNNDCVHCVIKNYKQSLMRESKSLDLSFEQIKKILDVEDFSSVVLTGGEVTIRKDFFKILDELRRRKVNVILQTNGRRFMSLDFVSRFVVYNVSCVVAVHGPNESVHDRVTKRAGSFLETVQGVRNLIESGVYVSIKYVVTNYNKDCIFETVRFCEELGVDHVDVAFAHFTQGDIRRFYELIPRYKDIKDEIRGVIEYARFRDKFPKLTFESVPNCILGRGNERFSSDNLQAFRRLNKVRSSVQAVNQSKKDWNVLRDDNKKKFEKCKGCVYDMICLGPWREYYEVYGDDEFEPL